MVDVALIGALDAAVKGRPAALAAFLRSDAPLTVGDREQLALLIEGKFLEHFGLLTSGFRLLFFWSQLIEAQSLGNNNKNIGSECFE